MVSVLLIGLAVGGSVEIFTIRKKRRAKKEGKHIPYGPYEALVKRPLDILFSGLALVVLAPVIGMTAFLVKIKLGSPILFTQQRPGRDEHTFTLYKFRTMTDKRDEGGNLLADDERLTRFGRILRSTSMDELPELLNIIRGDMSMIGPRPLLMEYLPYYTQEERHRHDVRPGLSGMAQVHGRNTISWEDKFMWDLRYVNKITFWGDMKILLETIYKTVKRSDIRVGRQHIAGRLDAVRKAVLVQ